MENKELEKENENLKIQLENAKNSRKSLVQAFVETNPDREVTLMEYMFLLFLGLKISGAIDWWYIFVFAPLILIYAIMFVKLIIDRRMVSKIVKQRKKQLKDEDDKYLETLEKLANLDD